MLKRLKRRRRRPRAAGPGGAGRWAPRRFLFRSRPTTAPSRPARTLAPRFALGRRQITGRQFSPFSIFQTARITTWRRGRRPAPTPSRLLARGGPDQQVRSGAHPESGLPPSPPSACPTVRKIENTNSGPTWSGRGPRYALLRAGEAVKATVVQAAPRRGPGADRTGSGAVRTVCPPPLGTLARPWPGPGSPVLALATVVAPLLRSRSAPIARWRALPTRLKICRFPRGTASYRAPPRLPPPGCPDESRGTPPGCCRDEGTTQPGPSVTRRTGIINPQH